MPKHTKALLTHNVFLAAAICITGLIIYLSLARLGKQPISFSHLDKIEHAFAYFTLGLAWMLAIRSKGVKAYFKYIVVICCVFFGIVLEVLQGTITSYRTASYLDMLANTVGIIIALFIFNAFFEKKQVI